MNFSFMIIDIIISLLEEEKQQESDMKKKLHTGSYISSESPISTSSDRSKFGTYRSRKVPKPT